MTPTEALKMEIETEAAYLNRAIEVAKGALQQYAEGKTWSYIATDALAEIHELTGQHNGELRAIQAGDVTDCPRCTDHPGQYNEERLCPTCFGGGRVVWRLIPLAMIEDGVE